MKKLVIMLTVVFAIAMPLRAETESFGGYTWTYDINYDGTVAICPGTSPSPTGAVTIPSMLGGKPVTRIGQYAFYNCSEMTHVAIPDSVTDIDDSAFKGCRGLANESGFVIVQGVLVEYFDVDGLYEKTIVVIPNGVKRIGASAFEWCSWLTSVTIPDGVTNISVSAFLACDNLAHVKIPDSVTSIGIGVFDGCNDSLFDVTTVPGLVLVDGWVISRYWTSDTLDLSGVRGIGGFAFSGCDELTSVKITDGVSIGYGAFEHCRNLSSVTIGNSVVGIDEAAFLGCSGLTNVTIGSGVTHIGDCAFWYCGNLTSLTIPSSVRSIGCLFDCQYMDCVGTKSVVMLGDTPEGDSIYDFSRLDLITYVTSAWTGSTETWQGRAVKMIADTVTSVGGKSVTVPAVWMLNHYDAETIADGKANDILSNMAANGCRTVGECYALGIDPENPTDDLKIAEFKMKDGKPEITLNHTKDGSGISFEDRVKILGKAELTDAKWQEVPPEGNPAHRFFKVGVEMP